MQFTKNLNLKKPDQSDYVNIADINENMDVLDESVQKKYEKPTTGISKTDLSQPVKDSLDKADNAATQTKLDQTNEALATHQVDNVSHDTYVTCATTSATAEKVVTVNGFTLVEGARITVKFANANTATTPTLKINTEVAKPLVKADGTAFKNIKAGIYSFVYSGTSFIVQGEGGEYGNVTANDVRSTKTFGTENGVVQGALNLSQLISSNIKKGVTIDGVDGGLDIASLGGYMMSTGTINATSGVITTTFMPKLILATAPIDPSVGFSKYGPKVNQVIYSDSLFKSNIEPSSTGSCSSKSLNSAMEINSIGQKPYYSSVDKTATFNIIMVDSIAPITWVAFG